MTTVDMAVRAAPSDLVQTEQPLTSVAAFALALVEASSRLTTGTALGAGGDPSPLPVVGDDDDATAATAAE
jgi:hypothetical protein